MIILLLIEMCLISATDCDKLISKRIKTYVVSDFSCSSYNSLGYILNTIELSYAPISGSYFIWYSLYAPNENEQIRFEKKFTILGKIVDSVINIIFDDYLILYINDIQINITDPNSAGQEKNINIASNLKNGENLAKFFVTNYKNTLGSIRFRIEIEQDVLV